MTDPTREEWPAGFPALYKLEESVSCPICKDYYSAAMSLPCGHTFCSLCLRQYLSNSSSCPACRVAVAGPHVMRQNRALEECVAAFVRCRQSLLTISRQRANDLPEGRVTRSRASKDVTQSADTAGSSTPIIDLTPPLPPSDPVPIGDSAVSCPMCQARVLMKDVNRHIDSSCKLYLHVSAPIALPVPVVRPPPPPRPPKASVPYSLYTESKLRKLLRDEGLPSNGDKACLARRHAEWVKRYNANLDERMPRSDRHIIRDVIEWEQTINLPGPTPFTNTSNHELTPVGLQEIKNYQAKYKEEFDSMIENMHKRKRVKSSSPAHDTG
ncbi:hypothetical protein DFS34DRAFT_433377 [Phlyctochytrium arcticum]|nr:hypothetical protein DFS34DRAFT_433377 [Phlyctochytrium arcticum]